jgi:hypothetical protein
MDKFIAYEVFEVEGEDKESVEKELALTRKGVVVVASSLNELAHPAHLASVVEKFS